MVTGGITYYIYSDNTSSTTAASGYYYGNSTSADCTSTYADFSASTDGSIYINHYYYPAYEIGDSIVLEPEPETEEQRQARLQREEKYRQEQEELKREKEAAVKRAEELLKEYIGLEAFGKLYEVGHIELDSQKHQGRKYRVPRGYCDMIDVLDESGKVIDRLCVHPAIECPPADHILTRVLLLELDEEHILAKANHHMPW